ncbi:MAG: hypothetical protein K1X55_02870 [Chitinophagales bacterium]|nr:hypothetical protein [Chitinophagales bacterium]
MSKIILNAHIIIVSLYLLNYFIKSSLFLFGNKEAFRTYRKRTMWVEMVFPLLFIATGLYNLFNMGGFSVVGGWFHMKLTLVLLSIPIGIVGMKKENKLLVVLSLLILLYVYVLAWTKKIGLV